MEIKLGGYLQNRILKLGKEKGYVTNEDVRVFYQLSKIKFQMEKLIILGYFKKGKMKEDGNIYWEYKGQENGKAN